MKRFLRYTALTLFLAGTMATSDAALFLPHLSPVRSAIVSNIILLTNTGVTLSPPQQRQLRLLNQARNAIDRSGRPSLLNDVQVLANVSSLLARAFPEGSFDPLLFSALESYRIALLDVALNLSTNVSQLPPSGSTMAASNTIADLIIVLDQLDTTGSMAAGTRTLTIAAMRLRAAQGLLTRVNQMPRQPNEFTARVDNRPFRASDAAGLSATFNPAVQFITITARDVSGVPATTRTINLSIGNVTPGTSTHSFGSPSTGTYASYSVSSPTNFATFTSFSGNATITLDTIAKTISGRFSFEAGSALQTGSSARASGGAFFVRFQ